MQLIDTKRNMESRKERLGLNSNEIIVIIRTVNPPKFKILIVE